MSEESDRSDPNEQSDQRESSADRPADESDMNHQRDRPADSTDATTDPTAAGSDATTDQTTDSATGRSDFDRIRRYVQYAVLGGLVLLGTIALLRFYLSASNAISTWIEPAYRSLFQAAFNLAVLLLAGAGIAWQLRRLGAREVEE